MKAFKFSKTFASLGVLAGLMMIQACGKTPMTEPACNFVQNSHLQRVSWASNTPVEIFLDASVPSEYHASIESAVGIWNSMGRQLIQLRKNSNPGSDTPKKDGVSKIYFMDTWDSKKPTEQGRTTVYWSGSTIYEADVRINAYNFNFFTNSDAPTRQAVHLESLILHELGHVLGLAHNEAEGSVMKTTLSSGDVRDEVGKEDLSSLKCEY